MKTFRDALGSFGTPAAVAGRDKTDPGMKLGKLKFSSNISYLICVLKCVLHLVQLSGGCCMASMQLS